MIKKEIKRIIEKKINDTLDIIMDELKKDNREEAKDIMINTILHLENNKNGK